MKKLLTLILLLTTTQLYSTETYKLKLTKEVESCVIVKQEFKQVTLNFKPKRPSKNRVWVCIAVQTVNFAVAEYALHTRNQELWNVTEGFFILSIPASFVYCWNVKID